MFKKILDNLKVTETLQHSELILFSILIFFCGFVFGWACVWAIAAEEINTVVEACVQGIETVSKVLKQ